MNQWRNFKTGKWNESVDVRDFIVNNYTEYTGDASFLEGPTENTTKLWEQLSELMVKERERGCFVDTKTISTIISHNAGYINKDLEKVVGLQTEEPLVRSVQPFGGIRTVETALNSYDYEIEPEMKEIFTKYRKTHNEGVFDVYNADIRKARKVGIVTGLPDAYGRGRIIGDYRRVALYGVDRLIEEKLKDKEAKSTIFTAETIRDCEEIAEQVKAFKELKQLGEMYGFDLSRPANNFQEATQWLYLAYLAATKEQNGAAMSIGRTSTFLDIYAERDIKEGIITEKEAQEIIDQFIMKLRIIRFLRTPEYNDLFSGDPTWVTESLGGILEDGSASLVTKNSFRYLHTLYNIGPSPEPNLTVLWSEKFPQGYKDFCAKVSIDTSAIQYESDDLMRPQFGDDYGIACCVSPMRIGKQMQFFGARANLAKAVLYAINGGVDEKAGVAVIPGIEPMTDEVLDYDKVMKNFEIATDWLAKTYTDALNIIHYMHDKYCYERIEMALHDTEVFRTMACGIAGLAVAADSLSAIKHTKVRPIRNEQGIAIDFEIEGEYPAYGNNDDRVDDIAVMLTKDFMEKIRRHTPYRNSTYTQSVLTITSNVVYGKKTGATPDGRKAGVPFSPGANPMNGRETKGVLAACSSVAKIPFEHAQDGISYTFSLVPQTLGKTPEERVHNMVGILDGYFGQTGQHINVNVLHKDLLLDAMDHPEKYPQLTIRVSGYAVNFIKLTREQQLDVISRTFHERM
ncbi:formate C-acetyltransferase [Niameybacter massiliensis]|uniref:Formate acetyltransferase n=1 Tax=Holtiella tumoricola TaxID=3018743 RepID=A0AA42DK27_9FIRM|nr:formate C-acetyltransferase [Holtiella tumoricola]MDA3730138.1 formate C-acetyltransferase [Holtiella tumoricola]